jgi:hypothetical protein
MQPGRAQNVAPQFASRARKAARTGEKPEQTIGAASVYGQMAGIVSTAKYAAATANAARYAAEAARKAGAERAAGRAERAAGLAASWADLAQRRAESSHYSPYTAMMTAKYARNAAAAAHQAARASGPLGRSTTRSVCLAAALLPPASRERYAEEWKSELWYMTGRRQRVRFVPSMLSGAVKLAVFLRLPGGES